MDGQQSAGSVFMCRLCNLFSPSRSQLLVHCSKLHSQQESPDDIIITLQPLVAEPGVLLGEGPVKRKRGRPKGSTKKKPTIDSNGSAEHDSKEKTPTSQEVEQPCHLNKGESPDGILTLECRSCHRSFSNKRQILKHICLKNEDEEEEERNKDTGSTRAQKNHHSFVSAGEGLRSGPANSVISVVLTEDETLPDVSKMVPLERSSAEKEPTTDKTPQQDPSKETTVCKPATDQDLQISKGFQEYSLKQEASSLPQSELKIFACQFCNKIFKFRHSLVAHLRTHTQEKPFKCPHCDYASAIKANLNVHLRKHTGERFTCPHCSFSCLSPGHLKVHIERVHLKMKQHCSFCDKKYSDVKNLLKHMEKQHNLKDAAVNQKYQQLRLKTRQGLRQLLYRCPTCNRRFKNQLERERHLLLHGPQRPFACSLCNHAVTKFAALAAHVRKHLFIYVCCVCEENLVSSHRLKDHLEKSHMELDKGQAFINSINMSYYLVPPEGGEGSEEGKDLTVETMKEDSVVREGGKHPAEEQAWKGGEGDQLTEEANEDQTKSLEGNTKDEQVQEEGKGISTQALAAEKIQNSATCTSATDKTQESCPHVEDKTQENRHDSADKNTHTSAPGDSNSCSKLDSNLSDPQVLKDLPQSAFQQVFSTLPKTKLDMETFEKLRKVYGNLECQYCGKLFWYKVNFNVHVRTHTKEHLHYCSECSYSSITKSSLRRHQTQKHGDLQLQCSSPGCKYTTPDKYKLQAHVRALHEQVSRATCPVCNHSYPEHRLKHHIKSSHPDKVPVRGKGSMMQRAEKCPYCDSYFLKNSSDFQQHIWAHQGLKPYTCGLCDYSSRSRSNLKTHMNRHNVERHHLCDLCGKKFKTKITLKSHRLSHTDEGKQFKCLECDFTSILKASLLRHMEQHAKFKPFRCAHCHYSCNSTGALKRHYNMKHPHQTYENAGPGLLNCDTLKEQGGMKCPECEFVYGTKWELNRHLKSKHNLKVVEGPLEVGTHYVSVEGEEHLTEAPLAVLEENVNIHQVAEFSSETQDAVTSMVAMGPGTVTVVQQLQVAGEQEVTECSDQLMVVNTEGVPEGNQVMVVEDAHGLEALTVLTQGENTHHYIVYVQEQTVEIN
ncbi:zinc finger protein ZFAT isoform X2 [Oryzias melastigma]|uniref:Zinc finger and AT-hook domain containing n=1 Tax=Oryzias melastigma TaxID=30732 RepID=A0A3B3DI00_ORYME|nr:zinc finger protein ZFAT isoform X2 [Oryzias melastigma]